MPKPDIQVLLVSAQAAPNLLPALDPDLKPSEVILLVTNKMESQAAALEDVLKEAGIRVSRFPLINEHDFSSLQDDLLELAATRNDENIALNLTGGTKLMALAAQSVAEQAKWRPFYIDVDTDEIIWLGQKSQRQKLAKSLRLQHYLKGYGFKITENADCSRAAYCYHELSQTLINQADTLESPVGQLNFLAQKAEGENRLNIPLPPPQRNDRNLEALLRNFESAGVLQVENGTIYFTSEQDRFFTKGGWLEHHVYQTVSSLHGDLELRDKAANLGVIDKHRVKNELDIAFLARNRLFIVECKTARMDQDRAGKANDTLFKLSEICRRVGGLGTRGMLVSYRSLQDSEKNLARALGIEVIAGGNLKRLEEHLRRWVKGQEIIR